MSPYYKDMICQLRLNSVSCLNKYHKEGKKTTMRGILGEKNALFFEGEELFLLDKAVNLYDYMSRR